MSRVQVVVPGKEMRLPGGVRFRREVEARRSRHRLYPVSVLYTLFALVTLAFAGFLFWAGSSTMARESRRLERRLGVGER